ncbi:MAG: FtsX-like permease family protein [Promethearchaeota archaeon]
MSIDFALKDFYRKKEISFQYLFMIVLIISITTFLIYFATSTGLNSFIIYEFSNPFFFSGSINFIYTNYSVLIVFLVIGLAFILVIIISCTLIISKKRDLAIMRALGSVPRKLYSFYLTEVYIIFLIGFVVGLLVGLLSFGIFALISSSLGFFIYFHIDYFYLPILFISCLIGIFLVPGYILRKFGNEKIVKSFSKGIPYDYNAAKPLTTIPRWLSRIGFNFKISILNTIRRKGEFKRYFILFSILSLIILTLTLGTSVLGTSAREWVNKSQGKNVIAVGHKQVLYNYTLMYGMFSNPSSLVESDNIDFLEHEYLFNLTDLEELYNLSSIRTIDERLIAFSNTEELDGYIYYQDGGYDIIGQQRTGNFPIVGINSTKLIQNFEIEGRFFTQSDSFEYMVIGDGLAYNFFDYAFNQGMVVEDLNHIFQISGIVIDCFYSGYCGYIDIEIFRNELNFINRTVNLILIEYQEGSYSSLTSDLETIINNNLGSNFTFINLDFIFEQNLNYITVLSLYPFFLTLSMTVIFSLSLYNYQKGGIIEKAKDFLIMRAIGSKYRSIKKILFLETLYVLTPSTLLSLGLSMILNSIILFERVYLPDISVPFMIMGTLFILLLILTYLSLFPIIKKIRKNFTIKDFEIY